jgi:hypothetical protein
MIDMDLATRVCLCLLFALSFNCVNAQETNKKLRVLVLTDIENEPDDAMSMPKLMHDWQLTAHPSDTVKLDAPGSTDPDGNSLSFNWFYYGEPGTFTLSTAQTGDTLKIDGADKAKASFVVPSKFGRPGTMHIILAVTDNGTPALTRYRRVIVKVLP